MDEKKIIWICMFIGSSVGSYVPVFWGGSLISFSGVIMGAVGGMIGIFVGLWIAQSF